MKKGMILKAAILAAALAAAGCATAPANRITQISTIDALLAGVYDGHMTLADLRVYGDFGIGTFEAVDGEMILLDGNFYKARADGKVYRPALSEKTPFASVMRFHPDRKVGIDAPMDMKGLQEVMDRMVPQKNFFVAFIVRGEFTAVKARSVPAQGKPYPPLAEVTKNQTVFDFGKVRGTLMGFRSPDFVKGVNVPGYHVHFLADDLSGGGHVLEFEMANGTLEADTVSDRIEIRIPVGNPAFAAADLSTDRTGELIKVEK